MRDRKQEKQEVRSRKRGTRSEGQEGRQEEVGMVGTEAEVRNMAGMESRDRCTVSSWDQSHAS